MSSGQTDSSSVRLPSKDTIIHNDHGPADSGPGFGALLANKLSQVATKDDASSDKPATNPDLLWSRPVNHGLGISTRPNASTNDNVTGWLSNGGGGQIGSPLTRPLPAAWAPANGSVQMNSPVGSPSHANWSDNAGRRYTMSGGNGAGPWPTGGGGQAPNATSPWLGSNNGNGGQSGGSWNHNSNVGNRQGPSPIGSRKSSGSIYDNVPFEQHAASWNNGGGNGNGSQSGGGWTNGNGGTNTQTGGNAPPASGW